MAVPSFTQFADVAVQQRAVVVRLSSPFQCELLPITDHHKKDVELSDLFSICYRTRPRVTKGAI